MELFGFELFLIVVCLVLSAFFSASEAVVMSMSVERTKQLIEEGGKKGNALKFLISHPTELLTTILVGNNLVNTLIATLVTVVVSKLSVNYAIVVASGAATLAILVFGEISPKAFARSNAEPLVYSVVTILKMTYYSLYIVVKPLSIIIKKVLGNNATVRGRVVTTDDIEFLVTQAEEHQSIDAKHIDLINSILEFPLIRVRDIMVPRPKVDAIDIKASVDEIMKTVKQHEFSRYLIYDDTLDNVVGFIHIKDFLLARESRPNAQLKDFIKQPFFVYDQMKIQSVFDRMNRNKVHMAVVKQETGTMVGIITLEDIMEQIFGEITDEHDQETPRNSQNISNMEDGIVISGNTQLRDLDQEFDIHIPMSEAYSTVTGFLLELLGNHFPKQSQIIYWDDYSFELTKVVNYQIDQVTIKRTRQQSSEGEDDVVVSNSKSSKSSVSFSPFSLD